MNEFKRVDELRVMDYVKLYVKNQNFERAIFRSIERAKGQTDDNIRADLRVVGQAGNVTEGVLGKNGDCTEQHQ